MDKSALFEKLKKDILKMQQEASILEIKFKSQQDDLKALDATNLFKQTGKKNVHLEDSKGTYDFIDDDPTIPPGWKSCYKQCPETYSRFMTFRKMKKYWAPNGKFCSSRRNALQYMVNVLKSSDDDIEQMKKGLEIDGWKKDDKVEGWFYMDLKGINRGKEVMKRQFINPEYSFFMNSKRAIEYLLVKGSDNELKAFLLQHAKQDTRNIQLIQNAKIPFPWRVFHVNYTDFNFIAPDGSIFCQVKTLLRYDLYHLKLSNEQKDSFKAFLKSKGLLKGNISAFKTKSLNPYKDLTGRVHPSARLALVEFSKDSSTSAEELEKIRTVLKEKHNWESYPYLPKHWMSKGKNTKFMTEKGELIFTPDKAVKHMEENNFKKDIISRFRENLIHKNGELQDNNRRLWKTDSSEPPDWKVEIREKGPTKNKQKLFLSPSGSEFRTRIHVLQDMIRNKEFYTTSEIRLMKENLLKDGWMTSPNLPDGWHYKYLSSNWFFLNPEYEKFKCISSAASHMAKNGYTVEATQRLKEIKDYHDQKKSAKSDYDQKKSTKCDDDQKKSTKSDDDKSHLMWKTDLALPTGWKSSILKVGLTHKPEMLRYLAPDLKVCLSRANMMSHMKTDVSIYSQEDFDKVNELLKQDGWTVNENLPEGWMFKRLKRDRFYLTPDGKVLRSFKLASEYLLAKDYGAFAVQKARKTLSSMYWGLDSSETLSVFDESTLPTGWKIKSSSAAGVVIVNGEGKLFNSRKDVISFLIKENYPPSDIFRLWNTLHLEGWKDDTDNLPTGWKRKVTDDGDQFLSPLMEEVTSKQALRKLFIENEPDYSDDDFNKVMKFTDLK